MKPLNVLPLCAALALACVSFMSTAQSADAWAVPVMPTPGAVTPGNAPIESALARIIPAPYRIELDSSVPASAVLVWRGGDDWMTVLREAIAPMGLIVDADWQTNTIRVLERPKSIAAVPESMPAVMPAATSAAVTFPLASTDPAPTPKRVSQPRAAAPVALPVPTTPVPPPPPAARLGEVTPFPAVAVATQGSGTDAMRPAGVMAATGVGAAFLIPAGKRLSEGLADYASTFGWRMRWQLAKDYVLDAPLPIPALSLKEGLEYVLRTYQARGGLQGATFVLAEPNHIAVARPITALEHDQ